MVARIQFLPPKNCRMPDSAYCAYKNLYLKMACFTLSIRFTRLRYKNNCKLVSQSKIFLAEKWAKGCHTLVFHKSVLQIKKKKSWFEVSFISFRWRNNNENVSHLFSTINTKLRLKTIFISIWNILQKWVWISFKNELFFIPSILQVTVKSSNSSSIIIITTIVTIVCWSCLNGFKISPADRRLSIHFTAAAITGKCVSILWA